MIKFHQKDPHKVMLKSLPLHEGNSFQKGSYLKNDMEKNAFIGFYYFGIIKILIILWLVRAFSVG